MNNAVANERRFWLPSAVTALQDGLHQVRNGRCGCPAGLATAHQQAPGLNQSRQTRLRDAQSSKHFPPIWI
jgi:hypothetical protein